MRVDLNYERHIKALDFAAARVDEESWLYRVRAGRYADSDMALSGSGLMDTTSERIKRLTQALVDISEQQLAEVPNWHGMATTVRRVRTASSWRRTRWRTWTQTSAARFVCSGACRPSPRWLPG